jgi:hypothetical protein
LFRDGIIVAKRGPVTSVDNPPVMHDASKRKAPPSRVLQVKNTQANYSSREGLEKLAAAVNEWNARTRRALDSNGETRGLVQFLEQVWNSIQHLQEVCSP